MFNGRAEDGKGEVSNLLNDDGWLRNDDFTGCGFNFAVCKRRHRAMMVRFVRILVNHFVQRGANRHGVQQQDDAHQQHRQRAPAEPEKLSRSELQSICNIASHVPPASPVLNFRL